MTIVRIALPVGLQERVPNPNVAPDWPVEITDEVWADEQVRRWLADRHPVGPVSHGRGVPWWEIDVHLDKLSPEARALAEVSAGSGHAGSLRMRSLLTRSERMRREGHSAQKVTDVVAMYGEDLGTRRFTFDVLQSGPPETPEAFFERHARELRDAAWEIVPEVTAGEVIRVARERANMAQARLAQLVGVTVGYVSNLERGAAKLTNPDTIRAIAGALGLEPDMLFAAAGRIPDDLADALTGDVEAIRRAREAIAE